MKKILLATLTLSAASMAPAQADDFGVSATIDYTTDYVFRGVSLADSAIQPGVEVSAGDFYAGAWFSTGVGDTSIFAGDEVDLYAGYGLSLSDTISADVGVTYYHYPQGGSLFSTNGGGSGTYEVYAGLALDTTLAPSVYAYYDFTLEAFTLEGSVGHSVPLGDSLSLDLGLTAGLVDASGGGGWEWAQASAAVSHAFSDDVSAYVGANFAINSEDLLNYEDLVTSPFTGDDNLLFFGTGISAGF